MKKLFYKHADANICKLDAGMLSGLRHRTVIDSATGAKNLALWQEEHLSGFCVPLHFHDCEEIITVIEGEIEAVIGEETFKIEALESILIPSEIPHGFTVTSSIPVKLLALFSSPSPKIFKLDGSVSSPPWEGGDSNHLKDEKK